MVVGSFSQETDVVVIGGGPGGYSAAFRAAELGQRVTIVDSRDALGGTCLHEGCIPSKSLLHAVQCIRQAGHAKEFGITFGEPQIDVDALRGSVQATIGQLTKGLGGLAKKLSVEPVTGLATFDDSRNVTVTNGNTMRLHFRRAIIATGSQPREHEALPWSMTRVWTPPQSMAVPSVPKTMLVVGENYMAVEIAMIYAGLGSQVTLMTQQPRLLPDADEDLVRPLLRSIKGELAELCTGCRVRGADESGDALTVRYEGEAQPKRDTFDAAVVAIGQQARLDRLGLEKTSARLREDGFVQVDEQMRTTDARIFAVGDVTGPDLLADKAIAQGRIAAEVAAGWDSMFDAQVIPMVVFTDPNIAWCGVTETAAKRMGRAVTVKKTPWGASGRAAGMHRTEGLTKLICADGSELVIGVGIVGANAAEMIGEAALAIEMGATATDLALTIHPHPTTCELISETARNA